MARSLRNWWRPPAPLPQPPPIEAETLATVARAATFNPTDDQQIIFAAYRIDAIAREIEQRRAERREAHPEHDQIVAEAMCYGWMLVKAGKWKREDIASLQLRLR